MDKNSTLLLSYFEITNTPSDLIADAFGIDNALSVLLPDMEDSPSDEVIASLFEKIRKNKVN
ncbi:MAG TPA: hypothetical protein PK005_00770 [Bacteroidales bacterium]|jgi:hypothetical protein|nr:hypothetical protein [Bacteroidales bacterium]MDI9532111.1 hypothetical protein [Bacteroidota bacterium]MBK7731357.1 hypothetical protein [Bacteroidales bacterium]MBP7035182.1 hypothetical protein [Bacteroidales bacterium]MBP8708646.1 hypothetical protein [Bacteroidales bacterium]